MQLFSKFAFQCKLPLDEYYSRWYIDLTSFSMTFFKLHFIVIFMYTMIFVVVLWEIPFRYDRIKKTSSEKKKDKKKRNQRRTKRLDKQQPPPDSYSFLD